MLLLDSSLLTKPLHLGLSLRTKEHVCYGMKIVRHKVCVAEGGSEGVTTENYFEPKYFMQFKSML